MGERRILENDKIRVEIDDLGAELSRIYDKEKEREVLWDADPRYWGRHACILFPIVGALNQDTYHYEGKEYTMKQHGFARNCPFQLEKQTADSVTHKLVWDEETYAVYPFRFALYVTHTVSEKKIQVSWRVENLQEKELYFSIGGHPAFRVPVLQDTAFEDYSLVFQCKDDEPRCIRINEPGLALPESEMTMRLQDGRKKVEKDMFQEGVYIFEHGQIESAGFLMPDGSPYLTLECKGFPYFGVWAAKGAPFICLEPWYGRTDAVGFSGTLEEREGGNCLKAGQTFEASYQIMLA